LSRIADETTNFLNYRSTVGQRSKYLLYLVVLDGSTAVGNK